MNTCTHKPTQEIYIHIMGGKSFHSIIYITPAAIPINSVSYTHTHTHTHTPSERHTQKNTLADLGPDMMLLSSHLITHCLRDVIIVSCWVYHTWNANVTSSGGCGLYYYFFFLHNHAHTMLALPPPPLPHFWESLEGQIMCKRSVGTNVEQHRSCRLIYVFGVATTRLIADKF